MIQAGFELSGRLGESGLCTVRRKVGVGSNVAATVVAAFMVTTQEPVPEQPPPLQPENVEPPASAAVNSTTVPLLYAAMHLTPQQIPAGFHVTVPRPVAGLFTVTVTS